MEEFVLNLVWRWKGKEERGTGKSIKRDL